jgi:hypothetical protein
VALKVEPCAEHKNEVLVGLYSTVAPAWGHTDDTAKKLVGVFPIAVRMMIYPLLATKSLIDFNSESKLIERPEEVLGILTALGAPLSSFEQDKATHATHAAENPPVNVDKNSFLFIRADGKWLNFPWSLTN